jgi:hypothetical protein
LQLILDNGVEEYILEPDADDLDVLVELLPAASTPPSTWSARC